MRYDEAGTKIEALSSDLGVELDNDFYVIHKGKYKVAFVSGEVRFKVNAGYIGFSLIPQRNEVFEILAELAATPLGEREKPKKHYIKVFDGPLGFLNLNVKTDQLSVYGSDETKSTKTKFTDRDIRELQNRKSVAIDWDEVRYWDAED